MCKHYYTQFNPEPTLTLSTSEVFDETDGDHGRDRHTKPALTHTTTIQYIRNRTKHAASSWIRFVQKSCTSWQAGAWQ